MLKFNFNKTITHPQSHQISTYFDEYQPHFLSDLNNEELLETLYAYTKNKKIKHLGLVGMGGSSLGMKALSSALDLNDSITFFDNVDSFAFNKKINKINFEETHWLIVSKSGQTQDVITLLDFILQFNSNAKNQMTIITSDNNNPLKSWAKTNNVPLFFIPENIGGRFSIFTPVGTLPLLFLNQDTAQIKEGATWALSQKQTLIDLTTLLIDSIDKQELLHLHWYYSDDLLGLGNWLQQLWMESLGKNEKNNGTPAKEVSSLFTARGSSDQHSLLQHIADCRTSKLATFISDDRSINTGSILNNTTSILPNDLVGSKLGSLLKAQCQATEKSLIQKGINTYNVHFNEVNLMSLSAYMTIYMSSVICLAHLLDINPFDQPGVELSKENTRKILIKHKTSQ